jgi:transcriptional regulator GlxA family with amidase domain
MASPLNIALLTFDGVQILDVTGPAAVFAAANDAAGKAFYRVHILSAAGGDVRSNSGVKLVTRALKTVAPRTIDTWLIAGGEGRALRALATNNEVRKWAIQASVKARRFGSVCSGTFLLAHLGLIDGKRVATHWEACSELAKRFPKVHVDANALYVEDGRVWTSAGVTTGIDMALALVERDLGSAIASAIAKRLVLYARRPGYQAQFSPVLIAQMRADEPFSELINWIKDNLSEKLDVSTLAARVAMSDRSFHRKFTSLIGETPAHFVESLRLDQARNLLSAGISLKEIAARTGYSSAVQFSKAFDRRFGMAPTLFREVHCRGQ